MLSVTGFKKSYNDSLVLAIDSMSFATGLHWIRGENGSGKSTLFKSIAGLIPFTGNVSIDDTTIKDNPVEFRKLVSFAEAEPAFPGFLSGKEIFEFVSDAKKISNDEREHCLRIFSIKSFYEKTCDTYSSGMLKKLSLTIAFLGSAKVVLLDEPLITLDAESCDLLVSEIKRGMASENRIFLVSSHHPVAGIEKYSSYVIAHKKLAVT